METHQAFFRFYEELNDFLPGYRKMAEFPYPFTGNPSVKDAIESIGVPHVEVDLILADGKSVGFAYKLRNNERISVYPVFETLDISDVQRLRASPLRDPKFILDVHLGRLAKYIRLCGFDGRYEKDLTDREIVAISLSQERIILTRDRGLLKAKNITHGLWIRSGKPVEQLREVMKRLDLVNKLQPFTRCMECNGEIVSIASEEIKQQLPERTKEFYMDFRRCTLCGRIYWEGSHFERMKKFLDNVILSVSGK